MQKMFSLTSWQWRLLPVVSNVKDDKINTFQQMHFSEFHHHQVIVCSQVSVFHANGITVVKKRFSVQYHIHLAALTWHPLPSQLGNTDFLYLPRFQGGCDQTLSFFYQQLITCPDMVNSGSKNQCNNGRKANVTVASSIFFSTQICFSHMYCTQLQSASMKGVTKQKSNIGTGLQKCGKVIRSGEPSLTILSISERLHKRHT